MSAEGKRTEALVEFVDIYPTLCDTCGLEIPVHCEGLSFAALLSDPARPWKQAAFSQYPRGKVMGYAMRTQRYRYIEWQEKATGEIRARELYDHTTDSQENVNCADRVDTSLLDTLSEQLHTGWQAVSE
jgi:arylsulfatase A-like enzyme